MIRDRRAEDLDRLCDVLGELNDHVAVLAGRRPRDWLQEVDAERSWVFDQAPVHVAPTRNVVGHTASASFGARDDRGLVFPYHAVDHWVGNRLFGRALSVVCRQLSGP
jgi:hypothetical protein